MLTVPEQLPELAHVSGAHGAAHPQQQLGTAAVLEGLEGEPSHRRPAQPACPAPQLHLGP